MPEAKADHISRPTFSAKVSPCWPAGDALVKKLTDAGCRAAFLAKVTHEWPLEEFSDDEQHGLSVSIADIGSTIFNVIEQLYPIVYGPDAPMTAPRGERV